MRRKICILISLYHVCGFLQNKIECFGENRGIFLVQIVVTIKNVPRETCFTWNKARERDEVLEESIVNRLIGP